MRTEQDLNKQSVDKLATEMANIIDKEPSFHNAFVATMIVLSWVYESRCDKNEVNWGLYKQTVDNTLDIIACAGEVKDEWKLNPRI